jgi:hypothetical protein
MAGMLTNRILDRRVLTLLLMSVLSAVLSLGAFSCSDDQGAGDGGRDGKDGSEEFDLGVPICDEMTITAGDIPPNLMLIVDTSGSMNDPTASGSGRTKLQDTKDALDHLLDSGAGHIRFCWLHFPKDPTGDNHCGDAPVVEVECGADKVEQIRQIVSGLQALGGTPTGAALRAAYDYQVLHDETRGNFVVLLTDGLPTCPNGGGDIENTADNKLATDAISDLHAAGIDSFIIGLGEDLNASNPDLLNQMAEQGGRARSQGVKYYQANSMNELQLVLQEIQGAVLDCVLTLEVVPEYPSYLWMMFDGVKIDRDGDHVNGWDYDEGSNQIMVYGPACDQLRSGSVTKIDVKMGCSPPA